MGVRAGLLLAILPLLGCDRFLPLSSVPDDAGGPADAPSGEAQPADLGPGEPSDLGPGEPVPGEASPPLAEWTDLNPNQDPLGNLRGVWRPPGGTLLAGGDLFVAGDKGLWRRGGGKFLNAIDSTKVPLGLNAVAGTGPPNPVIVAVGDGGVICEWYSPSPWFCSNTNAFNQQLNDVSVVGQVITVAGGTDRSLVLSKTTSDAGWTAIINDDTQPPVRALWVRGDLSDTFWVTEGHLWHGNSFNQWANQFGVFGIQTLFGWTTLGAVWLAGDNGLVYVTQPGQPTQLSTNTTESIRDIWGTSTVNVYAVGTSGTILHYDQMKWTLETSGTTADLNDVWGEQSDVVVVGDNGTILQR